MAPESNSVPNSMPETAPKAGSIFDLMANLPASLHADLSRRDAIIVAGARVFITHGYERASMDLVAQAAGAARRTLYNQFPDGKTQIFQAVVARMWLAFPVMDIASDADALADPSAGLRRIGYGIAGFWRPPLAIAFLRMLIGEAPRFPELMRNFFEIGKTPAVSAVQNYIAELGRRGVLTLPDPVLAAQQFLGLIDETVLWVRVMGDETELTDARISQVVEGAVDIFLKHYLVKD